MTTPTETRPHGTAPTPAYDAFMRDTRGADRRAVFLGTSTAQRAAIRREKLAREYLSSRGLSPETVEAAGLVVAPIGRRARAYGFGPQSYEAASEWGLFIRYPATQDSAAFHRLRLIDPAALERLGGGKYRAPTGSRQLPYDPFSHLSKTASSLLLIEGELNALTIAQLFPGMRVVGLPGKRSLNAGMAARIAPAVGGDGDPAAYPTVTLWLDLHDNDPRGSEETIAAAVRHLHDAGVPEVLVVGEIEHGWDSNDLLVHLAPNAARRRISGLLDAAEWNGPYRPPPADGKPSQPKSTRPRRTYNGDDEFGRAKAELRAIPATEYLPQLYPGLEFDRASFARCFAHQERTPSLHAVGDTGYYCHGCGVSGGNCFDAGAALWGLDPSDGEQFRELTDLLAALLLGRRVA